VVRKYKVTDDLVAGIRGAPFSHAALLDRSQWRVIESDGAHGVATTPLAQFIHDSHRILLIRPKWSVGGEGAAAVARAAGWLGLGYDFLGLLGFDVPRRFYCSELAVVAYPASKRENPPLPRPVAPDQLCFYGRILRDTGPPGAE
jgi:hypothetical protein